MLDSLITSKTRIQILLRFFLNPDRSAYLRELSAELGDSSNSVRVELNRLNEAKLIECIANGRTKSYRANQNHPLFADIHNIVKKTLGIDKLIEIIDRLGDVKLAFITGDYARGIDAGIIDLVLVGDINRTYLDQLVQKTEPIIKHRKIRCLCLSEVEYTQLSGRFEKEKGRLEIFCAGGA